MRNVRKNAAGEERVVLEDPKHLQVLCGEHDSNLRHIEEETGVVISPRGNELSIFGDLENVKKARKVIEDLYNLLEAGHPLSPQDVTPLARWSDEGGATATELAREGLFLKGRKKVITPKSPAQREYVRAINEKDMVFAIGPAGTGKTYLAMAMAVWSLQRKVVDRIIMTRPAVEAGEKLGFLPGDMIEKVNPYLRPLYDALHDMMDLDQAQAYIDKGIIEVAPLAFMRGRTLNDSFVVLDEAQNTTAAQMKMFLTRLGFDSKAVITGDITQVDLPSGQQNGLIHAEKILVDIHGIYFSYFSERDVVRHPLVQEIIRAYEQDDK